ncbi:uncharacterized protein GGS22DRAFT_123258 [Annulohypoxylon maeteangense]|uniref:uncharacterized protein n=1 Tax=Annulohypoxylon maeteangense TaxID=1927788 RepID=UPI0020086200|nr:uncharacterized protein GGS22DRAFT_123258 [Annulohypoxylon maeteangense]KAI0886056.1 hypothetical protein GGS22DRAFT_123258 [Annulohypoxylon maeteangense]
MMSFPDTVSGLLRALLLSLRAIGSTNNRIHEPGSGSSGVNFYAAELELQPWPVASSTTRKSAKSATVATRCAEYRNRRGFRLPDLPRLTVIRSRSKSRSGGRRTRSINRIISFDSNVSTTNDGLERSTNSSRWNAARHRRAVRKKHQASQVCWRGYWG